MQREPLRYLFICLFAASILLPVMLVEWIFTVTGSGLSVTDSRGAGQVTLLLIILLMVAAFSKFVAGVPPLDFFLLYMRRWRRALAGFAAMFLFAAALAAIGYLIVGALGGVRLSEEALAQMSWKIAERTVVGLFVVFILALTEEIVFRAFLMRYLRWSTAPLVTISAVVFASAVFAAAHNLTDPLAWFTAEERPLFVGLFLLGVLLCTTYIATGSLFCAVGIHAGLLGSKVFLRKTQLLEVDTSFVLLQDSADLRRSLIVWLLFGGMAIVIYLMRRKLHQSFAIEEKVVAPAKI